MNLLAKAASGARLSADEATALYHLPLFELAAAAHAVRSQRTDPEVVSYLIDRNINYSNVCTVGCAFCGFYRTRRQADAYVLSYEEVSAKVLELEAVGGTRILMQGGVHPTLPFSWYTGLLEHLKQRHPRIRLEAFSPEEIRGMAKLTGMPSLEVLKALQAAGLDGLPGGGGEMLVDEVRHARHISPARISAGDWIRIMDEAQSLGLYTTATMVIGFGETHAQRVASMQRVRDQQDKALASYGNGFSAFISWTLQTEGVRVHGKVPGAGAHEYLQNLAVSRLFLDNIPNFQASWPTMGHKVAQTALFFGANDYGSTMLEENVVSQAGAKHRRVNEREIIRQITEAGFRPVQRDSLYNVVRVPDAAAILAQKPEVDFGALEAAF
ncbi:cyclic dehypoxanthinyl futalosine synthase [Truepera radiovictrix]|uniref:Cyclic dehypoxanthine futalosine synthase n=1 Tax=Truepera radiovictrix (strain DSM 17093 / CIP 108686 / LMG 22925 / RQ-24) TaxID=649638 RepID=D7CXT7_TRURR|nr:cyclic dehypoxanthinyl futalosine synthase [Truepera radiovictrix]ADI13297.1 Radical SAM domain protein [Truepera radiovictrix DSM 17093]WMT58139.1 cyclic dehypoxanthinyl futalosine synthase [Truepera radiovictrix]